jgi:DNA-binding response OmpR family regulator
MRRVLIADDEPHMTRVLKLHLERAGYAVETVANGHLALMSIQNAAPDALVTDIQMPIMTGKQLCLALRDEFPDRGFPIFVMTSMTDHEHREWTSALNNIELLEKPLSMRVLTLRLDKFFNNSPATGEGNHA